MALLLKWLRLPAVSYTHLDVYKRQGFNNIQPGDIKYKDQNNDGVINDFDKVMIGGDKPLSYFRCV